jgi:imidazolonepropionase
MTDFLESFTPGLPAQAVAATPPPARRVWRNARVATLADASGWGLIERGAIVTEDARIAWIGAEADLPAPRGVVAEEHDLCGALLTPGLIDAHTHLVYGGHRAHEFEMRLQGASYEDIAKAGGGIRSTVAATRAASENELFALASRRLHALRAGGVTTVEIKSGYGLSFEDEARCLRVARRLGRSGVTVRTTSLAAHALPPEFEGRADDYIAAVCEWLPKWHAEGLVDAVDAFCERIAFSPRPGRARVRDGGVARSAREAARGAIERLRRRRTGEPLPRAVLRSPGVPQRSRHRRDARRRNRGDAVAGRISLPA